MFGVSQLERQRQCSNFQMSSAFRSFGLHNFSPNKYPRVPLCQSFIIVGDTTDALFQLDVGLSCGVRDNCAVDSKLRIGGT
jgi:hypothetical protein